MADRAGPPSGLLRRRLGDVLTRAASHRLTLVTAPAGSGKTTLLQHLADSWPAPVAWHRAEPADGSAAHLLASIELALRDAYPGIEGTWTTPDAACDALAGWPGPPALMVVDDVHVIAGSEGAAALERMISRLPDTAVVAAAGRREPGFDLSRLRVSGDLFELDADDLRFRGWEIDQLFREEYGEALTPGELFELTRRTDGWAAALHLFHLATRGMAPAERRRALASSSGWSRLVREYVVHNVLGELDADRREFLVQTSPLDRLTGPLCDALLERTGSDAILADLRSRHAFVDEVDDGVYRCGAVLVPVLRARLEEELGRRGAQDRHRRAGALLEAEGAVVEALAAFARAEAWDAVGPLLGGRISHEPASGWVESVPDGMVEGDGWLRLARARKHLENGELDQAVAAYAAAERNAADADLRDVCRRERMGIQVWLDPDWAGPLGWSGILRSATQRNPLAARREAAELPGPTARMVAGVAALLAGHLDDGVAELAEVADDRTASPMVVAASRLASALALRGRDGRRPAEAAASAAEATGVPWLGYAALAVLTAGEWGAPPPDALALAHSRDRVGDRWGAALGCLIGGAGAVIAPSAADRREAAGDGGLSAGAALLEEAVGRFRVLGAEVLEAWARAGLAVLRSRQGHPDTHATAAAAEHVARVAGVPGAQAVALAVLAACGGPRQAAHREQAERIARACADDGPAMVAAIADGAGAAVHGGAPPAGVLIGRDRELGSVLGRLDAAAAGTSDLVYVIGEAGVGKTRLVSHVAATARTRGARVIWTQAVEGAPPYWVLAQAVRALVEGVDRAEVTDALGLLAEDVLGLLPEQSPAPSTDDRPVERVRLIEGVGRLLEWATRRRPLVLVVDDAHHADADTVTVLRHVAVQRRPGRLFVVLAARDDELAAPLVDPGAGVVRLQGLRGGHLVELVREVWGAEPPLELVDIVDRVTGGNPAFVQDALRTATVDDQGTPIVATPAGVRMLIARRLVRLPSGTSELLEVAAALGDLLAIDLLARAVGTPRPIVELQLQAAADARVLVEVAPGSWRFATPAIRAVLADRLSAADRAGAHQRAADALEAAEETSGEPRTAAIAHHLLAAGGVDDQRLQARVVAAVEDASSAGDDEQAAALCEQSLVVVTEPAARAALLVAFGRVLAHTAGPGPAQSALADAARAARAAGASDTFVAAAVEHAVVAEETGVVDASGRGLLDEAADRVEPDDPLAIVVAAHRLRSSLDVAGPALETLRRARARDDPDALAAAIAASHWAEWPPERRLTRLALATELRQVADEAGDARSALLAHELRRHDLLELGAGAEADAEAAAFNRLAGRSRVPFTAWRHGVMRASRALLDGRFAEAERLAANAVASTPGAADAVLPRERFTLQMLVRSRELDRLAAFEAPLRREAEHRPETPLWRALLAGVRAETGRTADARTELDRFLLDDLADLPHDHHWLPTVVTLGEIALRLRHSRGAERVYAQLLPWQELAVVWSVGAAVPGSVARVLGSLAAMLDDPAASEHFEVALRVETRLGSGPLVARTKVAYGRHLLAAGDTAAEAMLAEAIDAADGYGMPGLGREGRALLDEHRLPSAPAAATVPPAPPAPVAASAEPPPRPAAAPGPALAPMPGSMPVPTAHPAPPAPPGGATPVMNAPTMRLRCFGRYALELGRASLDTGALKPRVRSLLWLLSVRAGQALHAELLIESLWPGVDLASGRRSLQVAVSSLRKALEPDVHRGGWERITRDGDSYRLALGPDDDVDITRFETGMATARAHRRAGRDQDALVAFERAVAVYGGDLVPEAGPADWAVAAREACRLELVDASVAIAELRLARGEPTAAIVACQQGIRADRYHDALWRLLMHAYDEVGDHAQAARARTSYDAVLAELGVTP